MAKDHRRPAAAQALTFFQCLSKHVRIMLSMVPKAYEYVTCLGFPNLAYDVCESSSRSTFQV